jgi:hypothetical protein
METELEEESYSRIVIIILGLVVVILAAFILYFMRNGDLLRYVCNIAWTIPFSGRLLPGYLGC